MRTSIVLTSVLATGLFVGCQAKVATVEVTPAKIELTAEKSSEQLAFAAKDAKGNKIEKAPAGTWSTSDDKVATIDATGKLTAVGSGSAEVAAKVGEITGKAAVTVVLVKGLKLEPATLAVTVGGEPAKLTAVFTNEKGEPVTTDKAVTWTVKDPAIATVADGAITGVAAGTTELEAAAGELKATAQVTVTAAEAAAEAPKVQ
jgi:uncharacterized protein YjdB